MFTKKQKYIENGKEIMKDVRLKGKELIATAELEIKEKIINGEATDTEKEMLSRVSGNDVDGTNAVRVLAEGVAELVASVKIIAETMASQTISQDVETPVEEDLVTEV